VDKLLEVLNEAFAEEWLAYYQYWIGAQVIKGPERVNIQKELLEHASEELEHAGKVAARIIQLGGTPLLDPAEWAKKAKCKYAAPKDPCVYTLLSQNIAGERCAIDRYQKLCEMTRGKDIETFHMSRSILSDELEHEQDLEDFANDIKLTDCSVRKK
jgi:bacterioferritin